MGCAQMRVSSAPRGLDEAVVPLDSVKTLVDRIEPFMHLGADAFQEPNPEVRARHRLVSVSARPEFDARESGAGRPAL